MRNRFFLKKSSAFAFTTLSSSLIFNVSSQNVFANGELLESKLFIYLCSSVTEEDIKKYDVDDFWTEQKKDASKNVERLKDKSIWTLVKLWKFADKNTDVNIQKDESRRKLALNFKEDVAKILKGKIEKLELVTADVPDIADVATVLKASKYEDVFFDKNNLFVKENFFKYSPIVKEIHDGYFDDNKTPQIKVMFRFVKACELINNLLRDKKYIKKLDQADLHRGVVNVSFFSADLVSSCFCKPENIIEVFSIFLEVLPNFKELRTSVEEMKKHFCKGEFSKFIKAYQEGTRFAYEDEKMMTTADVLNKAFKEQLNDLSSIFSDKESLEGLLNFQYGNIFSNINMFSSGKEGGFFTAHVRK